jgi:hypothetical protein
MRSVELTRDQAEMLVELLEVKHADLEWCQNIAHDIRYEFGMSAEIINSPEMRPQIGDDISAVVRGEKSAEWLFRKR